MTLPTQQASLLTQRPLAQRWLIDTLWGDQAVGIVGGEPKLGKSFLSLDMAVAVASGRPCLRRFAVPCPGRVLLYPAEDALHVVRQRLAGLCAAHNADLESLDVHVITSPTLRLDHPDDRQQLLDTVAEHKPRLLILDPFVRLHRVDENLSGEVAPILDFLRQLQRTHGVAVVVVHHARKGGASLRAGQALRGSSEFHAWGDSNLYLRRHRDQLTLTFEHRAAPAPLPLTLTLEANGDAAALRPVDASEPPNQPLGLDDRVATTLRNAEGPLAFHDLRDLVRVRTTTLCQTLARMVEQGAISKTGTTYALVASQP